MMRFISVLFISVLVAGCGIDQIKLPGSNAEPVAHHPAPEFKEKVSPAYGKDVHHMAADIATASEEIHHTPMFLAEEDDLWERIRGGFSLPDSQNQRVIAELRYFSRHPNYMKRVSERAEPYLYFIVEEVEKRGMPSEIALLPVVESAFQVFAYSHGRAAGIWQFIPGTGKRFGLKQNWWYDGRRDIYASTHGALNYLEYLHKLFDGDWMLALAAYNSGEGTVRKAVRRNKKLGKPTDFWSLKLPRETRAYVPKLIAISKIVLNPDLYNAELTPVDNTPYMARVNVGSQIDLALAADLADISIEEIYRLNPAFNRWATDPSGPHELFIPEESLDTFETALAEIPKKNRVQWTRYKIQSGDTISQIAQKFHTTPALIRDVNHMRNNRLRAGKYLVIPVASKSQKDYVLTSHSRTIKRVKRNQQKAKHTYTVRQGDSFWTISRKYKVGVRQLAKWNGMAPRDTLKVGQKLVILGGKAPARSTRFTPPHKGQVRRIHYTVRKGDSIARIASKFRVSINDVVRWNKLNKTKYLQPGQKIVLFVDVTKQSGSA